LKKLKFYDIIFISNEKRGNKNMKTYKVFEAEELENALEEKGVDGDRLFDLFEGVDNDTAVRWWVEEPAAPYDPAVIIIDEYMVSQGCKPEEVVYVHFSW
jgi:hypothetical protein